MIKLLTAFLISLAASVSRNRCRRLQNRRLSFSATSVRCAMEWAAKEMVLALRDEPKPADFTNCKVMSKDSDDVLFKIIKSGGKALGAALHCDARVGRFSQRQGYLFNAMVDHPITVA